MQRPSNTHTVLTGRRPAADVRGRAAGPWPGSPGDAVVDPGALLRSSAAECGRDAPPPRFRAELERLAETVNAEARLTPDGAASVRDRLVAALSLQWRLAALLRDVPEVSDAALPAPVFISGLPGSGTSLLQNLLLEHPDVDSPARWELLDPAAPAGEPAARRSLIGRARAHTETPRGAAHRGPGRLRGATRPGSCHRLLTNAFQSPALGLQLRVPGYWQWLESRDLTAAYAFHREQLQAITFRIPVRTLVLRDPFHAAYVRDLLRVYPDARVIRLHRDPSAVVAFTAALSTALRGSVSAEVDPVEVGREWTEHVERHLDRAAEAVRTVGEERLLDIRHDELVSDPVGVARQVLRFIGVEPVPSVLERVAGLARSTADSAAARPPRAADFGLSARALRARFSAYRAAYQV
ncbi:sulfotransferase [Streptomyces sp. NPDC038707]|uniref:sulfotransferase family protein n=1 Tax=Streptomyces sp. NPDC038707 TaxID=3154329 RepID=UPI0033EE665D